MNTTTYLYRLEGPRGEVWEGTIREGELKSFMPYGGARIGDVYKLTYFPAIPQPNVPATI